MALFLAHLRWHPYDAKILNISEALLLASQFLMQLSGSAMVYGSDQMLWTVFTAVIIIVPVLPVLYIMVSYWNCSLPTSDKFPADWRRDPQCCWNIEKEELYIKKSVVKLRWLFPATSQKLYPVLRPIESHQTTREASQK